MRRALVLVTLASCYDPAIRDGQWACPNDRCPEGYVCGSDGFCHLPASLPGDAAADAAADAAIPDGPVTDAFEPQVDGGWSPPDGAPHDGGSLDGGGANCTAPPTINAMASATLTPGSSSTHANLPSECDHWMFGYHGWGPEAIWALTVSAADVGTAGAVDIVFTASSSGGSLDLIAYIRSDCDSTAPDVTCRDDHSDGASETVELNNATPGTYYLFIDSGEVSSPETVFAQVTKRQIVGLGASCNGTTSRCGVGLLCDTGVCAAATTVCSGDVAATLVSGVEVNVPGVVENDVPCTTLHGATSDRILMFTAPTTGTYAWHYVTNGETWPMIADSCLPTTCPESPMECPYSGSYATEDIDLLAGQVVFPIFEGIEGSNAMAIAPVRELALTDACDPHLAFADRCPAGSSCVAGVCTQRIVESELNDTVGAADPIPSLPAVVSGAAASTDVDHFTFSVAADMTIIAVSQGTLALLDSGGATLSTGMMTPLTDRSIVYPVPAAGTYILKVSAASSYLLSVRLVASGSTATEVEANDTPATAQSLPEMTTLSATMASSSDVDYFAVTVGNEHYLRITTTVGGTCGAGGVRLNVVTPEGVTINSPYMECTTDFEIAVGQGTYFLRFEHNGFNGAYTVSWVSHGLVPSGTYYVLGL